MTQIDQQKDILEKSSRFRIDPSAIKFDSPEPHARGGQADIISAVLKVPLVFEQEIPVAVKKMRYNDETDKDKFSKSFAYEVDILAELSHPNIVKLLGFLDDFATGNACMIFTWEENGNVQEFLAAKEYDIPERISLIQDVTAGVEYLHTRQPPISHGDLKSLNILVNSSYRAIITDFGSARVLGGKLESDSGSTADRWRTSPQINVSLAGNQLTLTGPSWSFRWAAPEVVFGADPGLPSDMWALGWVVWEIITDKVPFHELCDDKAITLTLIKRADPSVGSDSRVSPLSGLCSLVGDCLSYDSASRPTANKCCESVKWMPSVVPTGRTLSSSKIRWAALLLNMGCLRYWRNDYKAAVTLFKEALDSASTTQDALSAAEAQNWLGEVCLAQHRYHEAGASFSQARDAYVVLENNKGRIRALDGLGRVYHARYLLNNAEESFIQAERICAQIGDDVGRASVLNGIGAVRFIQCQYPEARQCYDQALGIYDRVDDDSGRVSSLKGLGDVDHAQSRYEEADESFVRGAGICVRARNEMGRADMLNGMGAVRLMRSQYSEANQCFSEALDIHKHTDNDLGRGNSLRGLAGVAHALGCYQEAEIFFVEAERIYTRIGDDVERTAALNGIAAVHLAKCRYSRAEACFTQALEISNRVSHALGRASSLSGLGSVYYVQCRYEEAKEFFDEAERICVRIGNDVGRASALNGIAAVHFTKGQITKASDCYAQAHKIYHSISSQLGEANSISGLSNQICQRIQFDPLLGFNVAGSICIQTGNPLGRANMLNSMANLLLHDRQVGDPRTAQCFTRALEIYAAIGNDLGRANSLKGLGEAYFKENRWSDAEASMNQARGIYKSISHSRGELSVLLGSGESYYVNGKYAEAEKAYFEARCIFYRMGDWVSPVHVWKAVSQIHDVQNGRGKPLRCTISHTGPEWFFGRLNDHKSDLVPVYREGEVDREIDGRVSRLHALFWITNHFYGIGRLYTPS